MDNPILSTHFRAELSIGVLKIWFFIVIYAYSCVLLDIKPTISIERPIGFLPLLLVALSTHYFFDISNKWKLYFEEFEKWPKKKNKIGGIIVWSLIVFIFINVFISVELVRRLNS